MTPYNAIPQPIPVYDEVAYQHWRRRECTKGQPLLVYHRNDKLPLFMITRETAAYDTFSIVLVNDRGDSVNMGMVAMNIRTIEGTDYIWPQYNVVLPEAIPEGAWYMQITDNGANTYFTEWINFTSCIDDKIEMRFGDTCMQLGIPFHLMRHPEVIDFQAVQVYERFSFWIDRGHGKPKSVTETEVTDNGAETIIKSQKTLKQYIINEVVPQYIVDCFAAMKYYGNVSLFDPSTGLEVGGKVGGISGEWVAGDCLFNATVEFQMDGEWRSACCDPNAEDGVDACGIPDVQFIPYAGQNSDSVWLLMQPDGTPMLITRINPDLPPNALSDHLWEIATYNGSSWEFSVPTAGTVFQVGEDLTAQALGDLYNWTNIYMEVVVDWSSPNGISIFNLNPPPVIEPSDAFGTQFTVLIDYTTTAIQALGRFARITIGTSIDPSHPSNVVVWTGPEVDLLGLAPTVTNPYPGQDVWVRIQYFRHGCEYGTSFFTAFVSEGLYIQSAGDLADADCADGNYLVVSDNDGVGGFEPGDVVNGGELAFTLEVGQRVQASLDGEWWVMTSQGPGKLFPNLRITSISGDNFTLVSEWPVVSAELGRTPVLSASADGTTWTTVAADPESVWETGHGVYMPGGIRGFVITYTDDLLGTVSLPVDIPIMFAQARDPIDGNIARIYRSVALGPWTEVMSGPCNGATWGYIDIIRPWHVSRDNVVAAGLSVYGNIQVSQDGGSTWFAPSGNYTDPWPTMFSGAKRWSKLSWGDDGSIWLAGPKRICRSIDGGSTFNDVGVPSEAMSFDNPISICAIDGDTAIAGCKTTIFKTTDGGATWNPIDMVDTNGWFGDDTGYAHIENLGGGRIVAFSSCNPTPPAPSGNYAILSDDNGDTFDRSVVIQGDLLAATTATITYSGNVGPMIVGRDRWASDDGGDTWYLPETCNDSYQHNAVFLVNERFLTSTPSNYGQPASYSVDGGRKWIAHPHTYPMNISGMYSQSAGSTGYALIAKPRFAP